MDQAKNQQHPSVNQALPGRDVQFPKSSPMNPAEAEAILQRSAEQSRRIANDGTPGDRVDRLEQVERLRVPRPAQIHHQVAESRQPVGVGA